MKPLVELTHEHVGAVVTQQIGETNHARYIAVDDVGEQFQKRHFDDRLGWHETTAPQEPFATTSSPRSRGRPQRRRNSQVSAASGLDTFIVKPVRELRNP